MVNSEMLKLGTKRSVIRELFEFGKKRAAEAGADKVYDFSLGNPNVPAPECVRRAMEKYAEYPDSAAVHGYTSAQGDAAVRKVIADSINARFGTRVSENELYMTCGAAASLTITLNALCEKDDEFIIFAPYFPEYKVFITAAGGKFVVVPYNPADFQIDFNAFEAAISPRTKAIIVNSPNNPSGAVYSAATIKRLAETLKKKSAEFGNPIFMISDEPYRELVYDDIDVPYIMNCYAESVVCYSYSKSLSLPGERIGYIAVSPEMSQKESVYAAICGAGRALGYVCAPSLFQKIAADCVNAKPDVAAYKRNRDLLYNSLTELGYRCVRPDGAFYLFIQSPEADAEKFSERAKNYGLLLVPGDDFGAPGFVRAAYCVSYDMIKRSLPAFAALMESYKKN